MLDEFAAAMIAADLIPPRNFIADGRIHRCDAVGKPGRKGGAYLLYADGLGGGYQNWAQGGWQRWTSSNRCQMSAGEHAEMVALIAQHSAERIAQRQADAAAAARKAALMWNAAREGQHPYLIKKGICSNGTRVLGKLLLVPIHNAHSQLVSLQCISPTGEKRFLRGGVIEGCYTWVRKGLETGPRIYICEGLATGTTIHAATRGKPVVVAFSAGNLLPVSRALRQQFPRGRFTVCADNDHLTETNPGIRYATVAAREIRAKLAIPQGIEGTDYNDMMIELGLPAVSMSLGQAKPIT